MSPTVVLSSASISASGRAHNYFAFDVPHLQCKCRTHTFKYSFDFRTFVRVYDGIPSRLGSENISLWSDGPQETCKKYRREVHDSDGISCGND